MSKRMTKAESGLLGAGIVIALVVTVIKTIATSSLFPFFLVFSLAAIVCIVWYKHRKYEARVALLRSKYAGESVVQRILQRTFWQGQTQNQLVDSLGPPHAIDRKLLATKSREIRKYNHRGANRYGLRITLDDGFVTGWDQK